MAKINYFNILIENSKEIIKAGELLKGSVIVVTDGKIKITNIKIHLVGIGMCVAKEDCKLNENTNELIPSDYFSQEHYLDLYKILIEKDSNKDCYLNSGQTKLPFQFLLPFDLPSSLTHKNAEIKYTLEATIKRPWAIRDQKVKMIINISSSLDMNIFPALKEPVMVKNTNSSQPIDISISMPKRGFIPGELLNLIVFIENKSKLNISSVAFFLTQVITCYSQAGSHSFWNIIVREVIPKKIDAKTFQKLNLNIPIPCDICPSKNGNCSIISIFYYINLQLLPTSLFDLSSSFNVPITIGTTCLDDKNVNMILAILRTKV